jgi:metallophosphoesterase superfamily enzyme
MGRFVFHHGDAAGHAAAAPMLRELGAAAIEISAHLHPAAVLRDRAGTRLKLPALWSYPSTQTDQDASGWQRYILPAFSTWAAGVAPDARGTRDIGQPYRVWACAPGRVLPIPH